jgi:hypothetical protein
MNLLLWGITLGTIGKMILGIAVLRVHMHIRHEQTIDNVVIKAIKREEFVTVVALILIVLGFVFEILFYQGSTEFLSCIGEECSAEINAAFRN